MGREIEVRKGGIVKYETLVHGAISTYAYIVPNGKTWEVMGLWIERDVNATLDLMYNLIGGSKALFSITQIAAGVTDIEVPSDLPTESEREFINSRPTLVHGMEITITWGAAQTTPETRIWYVEY
jgi:hypothetical protein